MIDRNHEFNNCVEKSSKLRCEKKEHFHVLEKIYDGTGMKRVLIIAKLQIKVKTEKENVTTYLNNKGVIEKGIK